jgi:hypothetical protein
MRVCVGLFVCLVPLAFGFAQSAGRDEFFAHPQALCKALNQAGIETGDWEQIGHGRNSPFMCEYQGAPAADSNGFVDRNLGALFRVSGNSASLADVISIAVTIDRPTDVAAGQKEMDRLVAALFQRIGHPEPAGLVRSIAARRYYLSRTPYGVLWFNFVNPDHPGFQRVFWFRLSKSGPG